MTNHYSLDNDSRIYVFQEGVWDIKGCYSQALQDEDPLEWECSDDGRFSLSLLAHGIESIESKSASASALGSTRAGSSKQGHSAATDSGNDELSPVQHLIVNALALIVALLSMIGVTFVQPMPNTWQLSMQSSS